MNLAQHSYFNLGGHSSGTILGHELTIHGGDHYTPVRGWLLYLPDLLADRACRPSPLHAGAGLAVCTGQLSDKLAVTMRWQSPLVSEAWMACCPRLQQACCGSPLY